MKSPARAKEPTKSTPAKSAGSDARKPTKPTAKAKQVASPRRASAPAKTTAKAAPEKASAAAKPAVAAKALPAAKKPAAAPAPKPAPPKTERGTNAGKVATKPAARTATPVAPPAAAKPAAPPVKTAAAQKPTVAPLAQSAAPAPAVAAGPPAPPPPASAPSSPVSPKVAPVPKSVAPKAAPVPKPTVTAAPIMPPAEAPAAPVATDRPVSEAVPPRPTHIPHKMGGAPMTTPRLAAKPTDFKAGDMVVYPTHGVGSVQGLETVNAAGYSLSVIVVTFEENRMTLRVPVNKAASSGLRKLASNEGMKEALDTLKGRARIKRTMWSRRAQEYEAKINSGDPVAIAEVVRDLHRNAGQPDQSFSERQIYEQALDRLATEVAAIDRTDKVAATEKLILHLKGG